MKKLFIVLFCSFFISVNASEGPKFVGVYYIARGGEKLEDVLKVFSIPTNVINGKADYVSRVKQWNPSIKNWEELQKGRSIFLKIPKAFYEANPPKDLNTVKVDGQVKQRMAGTSNYIVVYRDRADIELSRAQIETEKAIAAQEEASKTQTVSQDQKSVVADTKQANQKENIKQTKSVKAEGPYSLSAFYMPSVGDFSQTVPDSTFVLTSKQTSPISVGTFWGTKIKNTDHVLNGSIYIASVSGNKVNDQSIKTPLEYGGNIYDNFPVLNKIMVFYPGVDFEKFSTLNSEEIANGEEGRSLSQFIVYATVGLAKKFEFRFPMTVKFSVSQSLFSSGESTGTTGKSNYTGQRLTAFTSFDITNNLGLNFLFKKHALSGPTELSINRFGMGVSYKFF